MLAPSTPQEYKRGIPRGITKTITLELETTENAVIITAFFLKDFGKHLAQIRRQKGVTQERLGEMIDMHYTYISLIERALKVDIRELFS